MTLQVVPLAAAPNQTLSLVLDGRTVGVTLRSLGGSTFIDVLCNGLRVAAGRVCRDRTLLTPRADQLGLPGLRLFFADLRGASDPRWTDFGTRFLLLSESTGQTGPGIATTGTLPPLPPAPPSPVGACGIFDGGGAAAHTPDFPVINVGKSS